MTVKMKAEKCFLFGNGSYKAAEKMVPVGIIVHSTGADNPTLKRYVQPSDDDPDRAALLEKLGGEPVRKFVEPCFGEEECALFHRKAG